jgi:hypothetical protein
VCGVDLADFWDLIERSGQNEPDPDERAEWLGGRLVKLSPDEIIDFRKHLDGLHERADTWHMWGAANLICGGASEDNFWFFQSWLVGLGRETFERAVANPDTLADVPLVIELADAEEWDDEDWPDWEQLEYVADDAYEEKTDDDLDEVLDGIGHQYRLSPDPADPEFDLDDRAEQERRYPRLSELFAEAEDV